MTKSELIKKVAENTQNPQSKVTEVVNNLFETISAEASTGAKVSILGFGSFETRVRKPRLVTVNLLSKPGTKVMSKEKVYLKFTPSMALRDVPNN